MPSPIRRTPLILLGLALIAFGVILPQAASFAAVQRAAARGDQIIEVLAAPIEGPGIRATWRACLPATFRPRR